MKQTFCIVALISVWLMSPAWSAPFIIDDSITLKDFTDDEIANAPAGRLFIGDMIFSSKKFSILGGFPGNKWPNGRLPIEFAPNVGVGEQDLFWRACQAWLTNTPIRCVPRNGETKHSVLTYAA